MKVKVHNQLCMVWTTEVSANMLAKKPERFFKKVLRNINGS